MTERPVNEIRPGDRVYLSAGPAKGSILHIKQRSFDGVSWRTTIGVGISSLDQPLRILRPGDVIPAGATYAFVWSNGTLRDKHAERKFDRSVVPGSGHCVILSMPTPEPTREEQRAKLVEAGESSTRRIHRDQRPAIGIAAQSA